MSESVASVLAYYTEDSCSGTPFLVYTEADFDCTSTSSSTSDCLEGTLGNDTIYYLPSCTQDRHAAVADAFGTDEFVGFDWYDDSGCTNYQKTLAFAATGDCYVSTDNASAIAKVFDDGSAELDMYWNTNSCSTAEDPYSVTKDVLDKSTCLIFDSTTGSTFFTRASLSSSSGISTGALIGIIAGGVVFLLLVAGGIFWYCRRKRRIKGAANKESLLESNLMEGGTTIGTTGSSKPTFPTVGESGDALWQDEIVISSRVPREKVITQELLSRGGYGEVYKGTYNGQDVAIKMLLPETRRSLKHVNAFLAEVKMMATLEHSCIVQFVGVAWDSLNDLCVLSEFMAGGDLRALLAHYEATQHPQGLDYHKVKIALQIAHALTYLHTLEQPVIHRDLKSKNVLLTSELHAKLTDFGVSRERIDATMTAGVGTSLWMAPEIMLGEKYGVEADVFSFGVMLSELDSHALPYATAKENSDSGRKLPDAAILQLVAMGKLRVQFSDAAPKELVELGLACVATDPSERPSASKALYRLQKALQAL